jgi:hypothetical protein
MSMLSINCVIPLGDLVAKIIDWTWNERAIYVFDKCMITLNYS